jgi:hypothetical protein
VELIVLGLVSGLSFLSYALWKRSRAQELDEALAAERTVRKLRSEERTVHAMRPGDVVTYVDTDWLVEGVVDLDDDGRRTRLYRLADGAVVRWLAARAGADEPLLLDQVDDLGSLGMELNAPDRLVHGGVPYRLTNRASVRVRLAGAVGDGRGGDRAWFYDYAGPGTRRLLAVAWSARTDTLVGEAVASQMIDILPGG